MVQYDRCHPFYTNCYKCGRQCNVPFRPRLGQRVYCQECFEYIKAKRKIRKANKRTLRQFWSIGVKLFYVAVIIAILAFLAIAYTTYSKYQPMIDDYNSKVADMNAVYDRITAYTNVQKSSQDYLSSAWLSNFKGNIDEYQADGINATIAGELLLDCPYYDKGALQANSDNFNVSLETALEYYNTPSHTVALFNQQDDAYEAYPGGSTVQITVYRDVSDPSYNQLTNFLYSDNTVDDTYIPGSYVCVNFAVHLYENAESHGIRGHLIDIGLDNSPGHMIDAFDTTDRGIIYIDATGNTVEQKMRGSPSIPTTVNVAVGQNYIAQYLFPSGGWYCTSLGTINKVECVI